MGRWIREPLLHFFVLGAALFALFSWLNQDAGRSPDEIVVDDARVAALETQFQRVWQRPPAPEELRGLVESWIREEILYREGLAMGLSEDDAVIRRRVAQKVSFISEDVMVAPPSDADLEAWFQGRAQDYRIEPTYTFRHVFLDPSRRDRNLDVDLAEIRRELDAGTPAEELGDATLLPGTVTRASTSQVARSFGGDFADALAAAPAGGWHGPVRSTFGVHLLRMDEHRPGRVPAFDEVRPAVERDYLHQQTQEANRRFYESLRAQYDVTIATERLTPSDADAGKQG